MLSSIMRISLSVILGICGVIVLQLSFSIGEKRLQKSGTQRDRLNRLSTLWQAGRSIGQIIIILMTSLMVLHELGVNITPILTSAGVVGLAFSLGAQTIIKDYLGGAVILIENQFSVNDVLTVGNITGTVEKVTLRATYLRDSEGKLNLIPNGDIRTVTNLTTQWSQVVITINVDYDSDMEKVVEALAKAAAIVKDDPEISPLLLDSPHSIGWSGFTEWSVQSQISVKTQPGKQWQVARSLRKAALEQLNNESIRVALPDKKDPTYNKLKIESD